jgi:hypothetical protein
MDLLNEINLYCNQKNNTGALLITGKWGSGKSYFIENNLMNNDLIKNNFDIIKISLFGIDSSDMFNKEVKAKYINKRYKIPSNNKLKSINYKALLEKLPYIGRAVPFIDLNMLVDIEPYNNTHLLFIFDDLERCKIDVNDLMGLINQYIEMAECKTIIIANEESLLRDPSKKEDYSIIKEKIISRTIKFTNKSKETINKIIKTYEEYNSDLGYKSFLEKNTEFIIDTFSEIGKDNLRILKCALQDYELFFKKVSDTNFEEQDNELKIFYNFLVVYFEYRVGELQDEKYKVYEGIFIDTDLKDKYPKYDKNYFLSSLIDWLRDGYFNEKLLENDLKRIDIISSPKSKKDIIISTENLLLLEEIDLIEGFQELLDYAYIGNIELSDYISIFKLYLQAVQYKIDLHCNINYKSLEEGIKIKLKNTFDNNEKIYLRIYLTVEEKRLLSDEGLMLYNMIFDTYRSQDNCFFEHKLFEALKKDNISFVIECLGAYEGRITDEFVNLFFDCYKNKKNFDRFLLKSAIKGLLSKEIFFTEVNKKETLNSLNHLKQNVAKLDTGDKIGKINDSQLIEFLTDIIKSSEFENTN